MNDSTARPHPADSNQVLLRACDIWVDLSNADMDPGRRRRYTLNMRGAAQAMASGSFALSWCARCAIPYVKPRTEACGRRIAVSIHVALNHVTHYRYDRLVEMSPQIVRLRPAPHCRTQILSYSLQVKPKDHFINWQQDPQANYLARLVFANATREFKVEVDLVAEMSVQNPFDFFLAPYAESFPFEYEYDEQREL